MPIYQNKIEVLKYYALAPRCYVWPKNLLKCCSSSRTQFLPKTQFLIKVKSNQTTKIVYMKYTHSIKIIDDDVG